MLANLRRCVKHFVYLSDKRLVLLFQFILYFLMMLQYWKLEM